MANDLPTRRGLFASGTPIHPRIWRRGARIPEPTSDVDSNIVILAALPNPAGTDTGNETVILGNQGNDDQELTGWKLTDDDGGSFVLDGLSIPARGSLTVTLDEGLQLGNRGDEITLLPEKRGRRVKRATSFWGLCGVRLVGPDRTNVWHNLLRCTP
jgi:hypothetical protein